MLDSCGTCGLLGVTLSVKLKIKWQSDDSRCASFSTAHVLDST